MVTVGGIASSNITRDCDWESMGVAILDLTLMTWGSIFDSRAAPYQVNTMISDVVGGGPDGNATKLLPDGGWTSTGLANLFTGTANQTEPYSPPGSLPATNGSDSIHATRIGAIVGGVIGGVVVLTLIGVLTWGVKNKRLRIWGVKMKRFSWLWGTKESNGQTRFDKPELQSTPATSTARPAAVTGEGTGVTSEITGTPIGELTGRQLIAELEERRGTFELENH